MAAATPLKQPVKVGLLMRRRLRELKRTRGAALELLIAGRLLEVAQGFVRRQLDDEVGIRVAATREGCNYLDVRMRLLEFLDASPDVLTLEIYEDFVRPRVAAWDLDLDTQAMRIVLRSQEPAPRQKRALAI